MAVEGLSKEPYPSNGLTLDSWYSVERNIFTWGTVKMVFVWIPQICTPNLMHLQGRRLSTYWGEHLLCSMVTHAALAFFAEYLGATAGTQHSITRAPLGLSGLAKFTYQSGGGLRRINALWDLQTASEHAQSCRKPLLFMMGYFGLHGEMHPSELHPASATGTHS